MAGTKKLNTSNITGTKKLATVRTTKQQPFQPIPTFYREEMSAATTRMIASWVIFGALIVLAITLISLVGTTMKSMGNGRFWLIPFILIPVIVSFFRGLSATLDQKKFYQHQHDQFKEPTMIVIRDYKKLQAGCINTHWFCGLTYVWCLFIFLILLVAATCFSIVQIGGQINWNTFYSVIVNGKWENPLKPGTSFTNPFKWIATPTKDGVFFFIAFFSLIIALFGTIFKHCSSIVFVNRRIEAVEDFYGKEIISPEEIHKIKKSAMIRDGVIFFVCTIILIGVAVGFYAKLKNTTSGTVNAVTSSVKK